MSNSYYLSAILSNSLTFIRTHFLKQLEHRHLSSVEIMLVYKVSFRLVPWRNPLDEQVDRLHPPRRFHVEGALKVVPEETRQAVGEWPDTRVHQLPLFFRHIFFHNLLYLFLSEDLLQFVHGFCQLSPRADILSFIPTRISQ